MKSKSVGLGHATLVSMLAAVAYGGIILLMDIAVAERYGTGTQAAVLLAAYSVPTVVIGMFSGGAIMGPFVPVFIRLGGGQVLPESALFLRSALGFVMALLALAVLVLGMWAESISQLVSAGFEPSARRAVAETLLRMLPMIVLHGMGFIFCSALVSRGRVAAANMAPLLIPLGGLMGWPFWNAGNGAELIATGYVAGAFLFAGVTGMLLRSEGFVPLPTVRQVSPAWSEFARPYLATSLAYAALASLLLLNQAVAGGHSQEVLAFFAYGVKLVSLALAFFTTIVNSVLLPHFARATLQLPKHEIWPFALRFIARAFALACAVSLLWILLDEWIVRFVYARGNFTEADVAGVTGVQRVFAAQIPFYVAGVCCWRMFNALGEWKPLLFASVTVVAVDAWVVGSWAVRFGAQGIAAAHTMATMVWALILMWVLRARLGLAR